MNAKRIKRPPNFCEQFAQVAVGTCVYTYLIAVHYTATTLYTSYHTGASRVLETVFQDSKQNEHTACAPHFLAFA